MFLFCFVRALRHESHLVDDLSFTSEDGEAVHQAPALAPRAKRPQTSTVSYHKKLLYFITRPHRLSRWYLERSANTWKILLHSYAPRIGTGEN